MGGGFRPGPELSSGINQLSALAKILIPIGVKMV
jgi:hypothetical protein